MALADKTPETRNASRSGCALGKLMATMPPADVETITAWFGNYSDRAIADRITEDYPGFQGGGPMVQRHRSGSCLCPKPDDAR